MPSTPAGSKHLSGKGSVFSISTDGGTTWIIVGQVKTSQFSGFKSDLEDITNMSSTGAFREYAPTLLDSGQLALSILFNPADSGQLAFNAAFIAQTLLACKFAFAPQGSQTTGFTRTFSGYVTEDNLDAQFDKNSTLAATIKITGAITDTPGA